MNLFESIKDRVLAAYVRGDDIGELLVGTLTHPIKRRVALQALKVATRIHVNRTAKLNGMPHAVAEERLEVADVLFDLIGSCYSGPMSESYQRMLPRMFLGKVLLPGTHAQDQVLATHGFRPPRTLVLSPNMTCNMDCFQCYAPAISANRKPGDLTDDEWGRLTQILEPAHIDRVITEFRALGGSFITITGGEPLAYRDKATGTRLIDGTGAGNDIIGRHPDTVFLMYTNGKQLTEAIAQRMVQVGNVIPCPSLEGFEEATDRRRGPGAFAAVMKALDILQSYGIPHGASVTVFGGANKNVEEVVSDDFIRMLKGKGARLVWYFPWFPMMASQVSDLELFPSPEDRFHVLRAGIVRARHKHRVLAIDFSDGLLVNDWEDGRPKNRGCIAAGTGLLSVNQDGSVDPCTFLKFSVPRANIKTQSLVEILTSPYMAQIRDYQRSSPNPLVPCFPRDHLLDMRQAKDDHGAVSSSPKCRICEHGELDQGIISYNQRCRVVADRLAREKYGFEPVAEEERVSHPSA